MARENTPWAKVDLEARVGNAERRDTELEIVKTIREKEREHHPTRTACQRQR